LGCYPAFWRWASLLVWRHFSSESDQRTLKGNNLGQRYGTAVHQFWSGIFHRSLAQVVLDGCFTDFYQEATGNRIALGEYFDRSYLHPAEEAAAAVTWIKNGALGSLEKTVQICGPRQLVSRLSQCWNYRSSVAGFEETFFPSAKIRKPRFSAGNRQSNPWIQSFDSHGAAAMEVRSSARKATSR